MDALLMISTDRLIFKEGSEVRRRQIEYAKGTKETHIIIFAKKGEAPSEVALSPNCFAYSTNSRFAIFYALAATKLGRFIIERRKITRISCQDPFLTGMAGVSLKRRFGLPLELQVHTDIGSPNYAKTIGNKIRKALALSYLRKADKVRVVSNRIKEFVASIGVPEEKIEVRPIHVDVSFYKSASITVDLKKKYPQFSKIVLMASRLEREKNVELALKAWSLVLKEVPNAGLVVVGEGSEKLGLIRLADRLGIGRAVVFETWADRQMLASYYKTADLFLNTSLFEGYGMTLVEAHAAGCKIVSTDVGVAREVGAIISEWDEKDLGDKLISTLK